MAVRKHLNVLERDSLLTISEVRQPMGRPLLVYSLSPKAEELFPKNYEHMAVEFLHDLKEFEKGLLVTVGGLIEPISQRREKNYRQLFKLNG